MDDEGRDVTIYVPPLTVSASFPVPKIAISQEAPLAASGALAALGRLRAASEHDAVFIALYETVVWVATLAMHAPTAASDDRFRAIVFVRDRAYHQFATMVQAENSVWTWRSSEFWPDPDEGFQGGPKRRIFERHIAGRPMLVVFNEIEPLIRALTQSQL